MVWRIACPHVAFLPFVQILQAEYCPCRVEVLTQGVKSKSKWWRKCPIQISHNDRSLLHKETSFAMFAEGSAAKEQARHLAHGEL